MNEDTVLTQLRDIHLPADLGAAAPAAMAVWPLLVLGGIASVILAVHVWRARRWRQSAKAELAGIVQLEDRAAQWSMLLTFAAGLSKRARRPLTLPPFAYRHPDTVSDTERAELIAFLGTELGR